MININNIKLNITAKTRNQVLSQITNLCMNLDIINPQDKQLLFNSFLSRENETSTGFEGGIAIPHARISEIKKVAIIYFRLENDGVNWNSMDQKNAKYIIALLVPKSTENSHLEILSTVATGLLNKKFTDIIKFNEDKNTILTAFNSLWKDYLLNEDKVLKNSDKKLILGITSCPVGIAHTYLAAEKLEQEAKKMGYDVKVETHGSVGTKNLFTEDEIKRAEVIIIGSDLEIEKSRFNGKKIKSFSLKDTIHKTSDVINDAVKNAEVHSTKKTNSSSFKTEKKGFFVKHLLSGVSYMIPFIIFGGLLLALGIGLSQAIYGENTPVPKGSILWYMQQIGAAAFTLMIPVLAGFIANSIAGRSAIAPTMIVSFIANTPSLIFQIPGLNFGTSGPAPLGFIGAILFGFLIGITVKWMNNWTIHKNISALMPIFIIPVFGTLFFAFLTIFVIGAPIAFVVGQIGEGISKIFLNNSNNSIAVRVTVSIAMGALLGAMIGFDMGGPINKVAFITAASLLTLQVGNVIGIKEPMGMVSTAIPIAPMGMGIATFIYRKHFDSEQRTLGTSAIIMGSIGISEGAIPFAILDPKRTILANVLGSAVAGAMAGGLGVTSSVAHGGPYIGIVGAISGSLIGEAGGILQRGLGIGFFFISIAIGVITTILFYGLFLKVIKYKDYTNEATNVNKNRIQHFISKNGRLISNSKLAHFSHQHKGTVIFSLLLVSSIVMIVVGSTLTAINSVNMGNPTNVTGLYGAGLLITSISVIIATIFQGFTVFKRQK